MKKLYTLNAAPVLLFFLLLLQLPATAQQAAFPGAEGGGKFTTGGRGGTVYEVTNLNDAGPGSLRDAISVGNRTIVFRVSGVIQLQSRLSIKQNNITIAGQTAPGDGICLTGYTVNINASNIILRYLRCRLGDETRIEDDAMNGFAGTISYQNLMIDHCSLSWSVDETGTFYGVKDFTLQWCILSESLYHSVHDKGDHGYAGIWGGQNATFHHNLLAHHTSRCPRFCGSRYTGRPDLETVDFRNNVIYNWGNINSTYGGEGGNYNMVNNYYKPGPATPGSLTASSSSNKRNRILNYTSFYYATDSKIYPDTLFGGKFYVNGNWVDGYPDVSADNWTNGVQKDSYAKADSLIAAARQANPFPFSDVTTQTAQNAYLSVLDNAGAILPRRDPIDKRIVNEARTGTATFEGSTYAAVTGPGISHPSGILDTQADAGGLPAYNSTAAPADTDHDGMPDDWETANGFNPNDASDRNTTGADGFTALEKYLNSITAAGPDIVVSGAFTTFAQTTGTPSAPQAYTVSGTNLTGNITITPPANFEVSADNGGHWYGQAAPLMLMPGGGTVNATTVSVRLNASVGGSYAGTILHTGAGANAVSLPVRGNTITAPPDGTSVIVAQDGSGNYNTVQAAIDAAPTGRTTPYIIFIRNGTYREKVTIPSNKPFLQLIGESVANTKIIWDDYNGKANPAGGVYGTSNSATVTVNANDFLAASITFENAVGYTGDGPQALAINVNSDRAVFRNCRFTGGQDTLLANGNGKRQYFRNCYIDGNTDFIFGSAIAIFDSCVIFPRDRVDGSGNGYVTAANTPPGQTYGYVFRDCRITMNRGVTSYTLGRPWQNDASTADAAKSNNKVIFLNTTMGNSIRPEGWSIWDAGTDVTKITFAEYKTKKFDGTPADVSQRVSWSKQLTDAEAAVYYNTSTVFSGWDPCSAATSVCVNSVADIAVSNFRAKKGTATTPSVLTWNISWPLAGIRYELYRSSDRSNFSRVYDQTATNDTAVNFLYTDSVPPAGVTYSYFVKATRAALADDLTDTIQVSSTPLIVLGGTLGIFAQTTGSPSGSQSYTVSGSNLTDVVTIVPPAGYEISNNGGTSWVSSTGSIVLAPAAGILAPATISVRLNAAASGNYSGNIVHTSTGALTANQPVTGSAGDAPPATSNVLVHWPLTTNSADSVAVRADGVTAGTPVFGRFQLSDGVTVPAIPAYSGVNGQAFAATANGTWTTPTGPSSNLNRTFYEQFTMTAANGQVRVDSIVLSSAFYNTASNTKLAVVYSKTGFSTADSTNVTGGTALIPPAASTSLSGTANGAFATPVLLLQSATGPVNTYAFALNNATGVTLGAGQTLTIRLYYSCGSTSAGRYALLKDVKIRGAVSTGGALPLRLLSFTGTSTAVANQLQWKTADEVNTDRFMVERSRDGLNYSAIGTVAAGNHTYSFTDATAGSTGTFYRLKMMDKDGAFVYSQVVYLYLKEAGAIKVYPDPVQSILTVLHPAETAAGSVQILGLDGKLWKRFTVAAGTTSTPLHVGTLPQGVYLLQYSSEHMKAVKQFVKK